MKETIIALAVTLMVAALVLAAIRHGQHVSDLEHAVMVLERQIAARQQMLDDLHRLVPLMRHEVVKIQSELTAYDMMQIIRRIADESDCVVAH